MSKENKTQEQEMRERRTIDEFLAGKKKGQTREGKAIKFYREGGLFFPERIIRKNLYLEEHGYKYWIPIFLFGFPLMLWVPEYSGLRPSFSPFTDQFWCCAEEKGMGRVEIKIRVNRIKTEIKEALGELVQSLEAEKGFPHFQLDCVNPLIISFRENEDDYLFVARHGC